MKKIFITLTLLVAGIVSSFAVDYTARVFVTMGSSQVKIREAATLNDGYTAGYCVLDANGTGVVVYNNITEGSRWSQWGCKDIEGIKLAFTPTATSVSFSFSDLVGTLYLVDATDGSRTPIVAGTPYNFTVAAGEVGTAINDRFSISKLASIATEICHRYGKLQVTGSYGMTVKVLNMDGSATSIADTNITSDATVEIDLAGLATGQYKVEWNSQTLIIDVK